MGLRIVRIIYRVAVSRLLGPIVVHLEIFILTLNLIHNSLYFVYSIYIYIYIYSRSSLIVHFSNCPGSLIVQVL